MSYLKNFLIQGHRFTYTFPSFIALDLIFHSLIHLDLIFVHFIRYVSNLLFCMLFSFLCTICWKDYSFSFLWSWQPCQKSTDCRLRGLFPDSQFCSFISEILCRTTLTCTLKLCVVSFVFGSVSLYTSFFISRLLSLSWVPGITFEI